MTDSISVYRARVIARHKAAFAFHDEVMGAIERALAVPRRRGTLERLVLDMLLLQAFKSHATVSLLAQHGFMEDTATVARRLMELSVASIYIGAESEAKLRKRRSGMYLAFMWRTVPHGARRRLPPQGRREWSRIARRYGRFIPASARRWGPSWFDMFKEIGQDTLYRTDYAFLSSIAHGHPSNQFFTFAGNPIPVHNDRFASVLLIYSTKYCLAALEQWNRRFRLISPATFSGWVTKAGSWRRTALWP